MQRSFVNQISLKRSIYNSNILGMNSSIQSPLSNIQKQVHLKKSRIVNIPQTKNFNFEGKIDFVVVFQAIQIQRISQQLKILRSKITQYERQLFNSQNYQIQIKQLTQKCYKLQKQKNLYREQLQQNKRVSELIYNQLDELKNKYHNIDFISSQKYKLQKLRNQQLLKQVQKWKSRYNVLDQSKSQELENIKNMMLQQKKKSITKQTKELFQKFQMEKQSLEEQLKNHKQLIIQKQTQLKKLNFQLQKNQTQIQLLDKQIDQYQQKVALFAQQNYRFTQLVKNKQNQINKLKKQIQQLNKKVQNQSQEILSKTQQNKKIIIDVRELTEKFNNSQNYIKSLQKIQIQDKQKLSQFQRVKFVLAQTNQDVNSKIKALQRKDKKIFNLQEQLKQSQTKQQKLSNQLQNLKSQNNKIGIQLKEIINKIQEKSILIQKLQQKTNEQINNQNLKFKQYQQQANRQIQILSKKSLKMIEQNQSSSNYITQLQQNIYTNNIDLGKQKQKNIELTFKLQKSEQYKIQNIQLIQEVNRLKKYIQKIYDQKQIQIKDYKKKYQNVLEQKIKSQKLIKDYKQKNQSITQDKNKTVSKYQKQIQSMQLYYQSSIKDIVSKFSSSYSTMQNQISTLINRIIHMQKMIISIKNFIRTKLIKNQQEFNKKIKIFEYQIKLLMENYQNFAQNKSSIYSISQQIIDFKDPNTSLSILQRKNRNQRNQNYNSSNFINEESNTRFSIKASINDQYSNIPEQFLLKYVLMCAQIQSLRKRVGDKNAKVQQMKNSLRISTVVSNHSNHLQQTSIKNVIDNKNSQFNSNNNFQGTQIRRLSINPFLQSTVSNQNYLNTSRSLDIRDSFIQRISSPENMDARTSKDHGLYTSRQIGSPTSKSGFKFIQVKKSTHQQYN